MITEATTVILSKKLDIVDMAGEKVMADFDTGKYYILKGAANDIWAHIQSNITVAQLRDRLLDQYEIDAETCLSSTVAFLTQLYDNGFIELK